MALIGRLRFAGFLLAPRRGLDRPPPAYSI